MPGNLNIITQTTIDNFAAEAKDRFALKTDSAAAIKSGKVTGNKVEFFTEKTPGENAAFSFDFPAELVLDQARTKFVEEFTFSADTYPSTEDPNMNGKPVMVLAVKGENDTVTYSFLDMSKLVDTYKPKTEGKDGTTTVTVEGYEIDVAVKVSADSKNALKKGKDGGLFVPEPEAQDISGKADKDTEATEGNVASFDSNGNPVDGGVKVEDLLTGASVKDYTREEIAAMFADE